MAPTGRLLAAAFSLVLYLASVSGVSASESAAHAIAMHGDPKYPDGFLHFDYVNPDAPRGGVLRMTPVGTFDTLNPYGLIGVPGAGISSFVFERLLARSRDEPFTLYGLLAERVEVPEDRSWITFHLDPNARFHTGEPVTVDDVIFSWRLLRDHGRANQRSFYRKVERCEQVGPLAVRMTFARPADSEMPLIMGLMSVLPRSVYEGVDFENSGMMPPVGSGPYRFGSVDPGRAVVLERDPDYWGRDLPVNRGRFNFDTIRYDYYRDAATAFEAFKTGQASVRWEPDAGRWASGYDFPAVRSGAVEMAEIPHGRPSGMFGIAMNTRRAPLDQKMVREALAHALDFEWINQTLLHGAYTRTRSHFDNSALAATGAPDASELALLTPYLAEIPQADLADGYRPPSSDGTGRNRANLRTGLKLLRAAGFRISDGVLRYPGEERPLELELLLGNSRLERLAGAYADSLKTLGISLAVRTVDRAQYQQRLTDFDFDLIFYNWYNSLSPGNEQEHFWGSAAADRPGTRNYPGVRSAGVDAMISHLTRARAPEDFVAAARALDRLLLAGRYVVPLYHLRTDRVAWQKGMRRPAITPLYGFTLDTWWWEPDG